tara:strand:+ start:154 stop:507 length:354 start_codon:yes stop_codon:yes gene_type:complete
VFNKIRVYIIVIKVWFTLLFLILKDTSFLYLAEGSTGKFKLFGKQYIKQARYEASGKKPKSKSVTYITSLSKSFSGDDASKEEAFKSLLKYTFLWYTFSKYMQLEPEDDHNEDSNKG